MQILTTFGISKLTKNVQKSKQKTKTKSDFMVNVFIGILFLPFVVTDLASSIVYIYRLPQLRGRVAVHAEQVDDAAAEAGREAILPRHLLQGKPHSVGHWPFTGCKKTATATATAICDASDLTVAMTVQRSLRSVDCTYCIWYFTSKTFKKIKA